MEYKHPNTINQTFHCVLLWMMQVASVVMPIWPMVNGQLVLVNITFQHFMIFVFLAS